MKILLGKNAPVALMGIVGWGVASGLLGTIWNDLELHFSPDGEGRKVNVPMCFDVAWRGE